MLVHLWMILPVVVMVLFSVWSFDRNRIVVVPSNHDNRMSIFHYSRMRRKCGIYMIYSKSMYNHQPSNTRQSVLFTAMSLTVRIFTSDRRSSTSISNQVGSSLSFSSSYLSVMVLLKSFVLVPAMNIKVLPQFTTTSATYNTIPRHSKSSYPLPSLMNHWDKDLQARRQQSMYTSYISRLMTPSAKTWTRRWMTTATSDNTSTLHDDDDDDDATPYSQRTTSITSSSGIDSTNNDKMHSHSDSIVRTRTLQWVRQIVIGLNLCPFALQPYKNQQIKVVIVRNTKNGGDTDKEIHNEYNYDDYIIQQVQNEIELLVQNVEDDIIKSSNNKDPTTTLIVCPECYPNDFTSYLNIVHEIEDMIEDSDEYDGVVQLASFHPKYCFDGSSNTNDPDNCTNQSPYPTFHLLREIDVSHVVDTVLPNQDSSIVWSRNVDLLRTLQDELSETEFTSVLTIPPPPPPIFKEEQLSNVNLSSDVTPHQIKSKKDLIFRVRQILRRFPISLLRTNDK